MRNKVLLKVAGVYGMVIGILACITIIGVIIGVPMIIGANRYLKLYQMSDSELRRNRDSVLGWSIFFLFFGFLAGVLGLVFYLLMDQEMVSESKVEVDPKEELERLKSLYDDHLISKQEYDEKKKKILGL